MTAKARMSAIRLLEKAQLNKYYFKKIGVQIKMQKKEKFKDE